MRNIVLSLLVPLVAGSCLPDAIPPENRKNLVNPNGETYPVGLFVSSYAASYAAQYLGSILIQEMLGYNTTLNLDNLGSGALSGYYGLTGCSTPTNTDDRGCIEGVMQMLAWPWKVPLLNVTDCIISFCIVLTVTTSTLYLNKIDPAMYGFASGVSTAMLSGIFGAISIMVCMTVSALIYRSAMGGQKELRMFNLGRVPNSEELSKKVKEMAMMLEKSNTGDIASKLAALSVFDTQKITTCVTLLATEVAPPLEDARSFKFNKRIASSSFDPALKRKPQSLRLTRQKKEAEPAMQQAENVEKDVAHKSEWI